MGPLTRLIDENNRRSIKMGQRQVPLTVRCGLALME